MSDWRAEGGKIFDDGSQTGAAILIAVKNPDAAGPCRIHYRDIGDGLSRDEKLAIVAASHLPTMDWEIVTPNADGDWRDHRDKAFGDYTPIAVKRGSEETAVFTDYSGGLKTDRDAWVYNFSDQLLEEKITAAIDFYNQQVDQYQAELAKDPDLTVEDAVDYDDTKISWLSGLLPKVQRGQHLTYQPNHRRMAMYRPFCKMHVYFDADLNDRRGRLHHLFPRADLPNFGLSRCATGRGHRRRWPNWTRSQAISTAITSITPPAPIFGANSAAPTRPGPLIAAPSSSPPTPPNRLSSKSASPAPTERKSSIAMTDITQLHRVLVARVLDSNGKAPQELRRAAFDNAGLSEPMRTLIEKVGYHSHAVTDDDIAAVRAAGLSEDQIFEIVVCAAIGQADRQYNSARAAVASATGERGSRR
jgi:Type ISP C-terminal specificity domain